MSEAFSGVSRREFLRLAGFAGAALAMGPSRYLLLPSRARADLTDFSPIAALTGSFPSTDFNGDDIRHPHDVLWNLEPYIRAKGGRPETAETTDTVVVGGGMAGLLSAYFLRDRRPLVLEQAERFGGNAKGEKHEGCTYSIGAAYLTIPEAGGPIDSLLRELGIRDKCRLETSDETKVTLRGRGLLPLWSGELEPESRSAFSEATALLKEVSDKGFPEIPWSQGDALKREEILALDSETAEHWLQRKLPRLPAALKEYFQLYCWSSFGGSLSELSAAQFLNFVAAETEGVLAFPGGNSAIAAALVQKLQGAGAGLFASSIVLEVAERNGGVEVLYEDSSGRLRLLRARAVVVASPKYVARYLVKGISKERDELWKSLPYRAYVVANVLLDGPAPSAGFDVYSLEGKVPDVPTFGHRTDRPWTDACFGDWAAGDRAGASVLTFYRPLPFEGARPIITSPIAHDHFRKDLLSQIGEFLGEARIGRQVKGVRLTRWGHSIPLARPGYVLDERIGAPHGARIVFANQDNYMNPAFESAFAAATRAAAAIS